MTRLFTFNIAHLWRKAGTVFLAQCFLSGLCFGAIAHLLYGRFSFPLMDGVFFVSIVGHFLSVLFPFLISALAVFISRPWLLLPVAFGKGFSFFYVSVGTLSSLGSSGGFFRLLLMFSDIICLPLLYFFWHRHIRSGADGYLTSVFVLVSFATFIGCVDFTVVLPLITEIINF